MVRRSYLSDVVFESPSQKYVLNMTSSCGSEYEYVTLSPCYKKQAAASHFSWFRSMLSSCNPENGHETISAMVEVFKVHKDEFFAPLREYVLMEGIALMCFRLKLEDSDLICEVLNLFYICWHSFGPLHRAAILRSQNRKKGNFYPRLISFFLEHARRKKLEYRSTRMVDISVYSTVERSAVIMAAETWNWKATLVYLQYGAILENLYQDPANSQYFLSSGFTEILRKLVSSLWFRLIYPASFLTSRHHDTVDEYLSNLDTSVRSLCRTLKVLLRAARRVQFGSLDYVIKDDRGSVIVMVPSREVLTHYIVKLMVPKLFERYAWPEELKHICRWTIRKRLNENWQLPGGIRDLPVPDRIKRYLNLLVD